MDNKLLFAQDLAHGMGGLFSSGFNARIQGESMIEAIMGAAPYSVGEILAGWNRADDMVRDGEIYAVERFHHEGCRFTPAPFGGDWVCSACGSNKLYRGWWAVRVQKDGDQWCCVGLGFVNLQESDNYAFGPTKADAIHAYGLLMRSKEPSHEH